MAEASPKSISDKLRQGNLTNIAKKINAGKTLTKTEQAAIDAYDAINGVKRRLGKLELAAELGISRPTLDEYLEQQGAPQPDENGTYSVEDAGLWVANNSVTAVSSKEMRRLREALTRIRLDREEIELAKVRGTVIEKAKIAPTVAAFMTKLTTDLVDIFEKELPSKCHGRTTIQIAELQAEGVDRVLKRLKAGAEKLIT